MQILKSVELPLNRYDQHIHIQKVCRLFRKWKDTLIQIHQMLLKTHIDRYLLEGEGEGLTDGRPDGDANSSMEKTNVRLK